MQKFSKDALIKELEKRLAKFQKQHATNTAKYPAQMEAWKKRALAVATEMIKAGEWRRYDMPEPPSEPQDDTSHRYEQAIHQLGLMEGDTVSLKPDDHLLRLAL